MVYWGGQLEVPQQVWQYVDPLFLKTYQRQAWA